MSFTTVSERLAAVSDALRELVQALGPCGSFDKKGNCRNHFATCPCPVGEADLLLAKMRDENQEPERIYSAFDQLIRKNQIVARIMLAGGTAEDCAVSLAAHNDRLVHRLMALEGIAPRKIKLQDGRVMVWRCPDNLIPETKEV